MEENEHNICDVRGIWDELVSKGLRVIELSLRDIVNGALELAPDGSLRVRTCGTEITVVYFRAGYSPKHYPDESYFEALLLLEKSVAIKCPSVDLLLVTLKKV